jgi:hypothetical protein
VLNGAEYVGIVPLSLLIPPWRPWRILPGLLPCAQDVPAKPVVLVAGCVIGFLLLCGGAFNLI